MIPPTDNVKAINSFNRTFWQTAVGHTQAVNLDSSMQNAINRWSKIDDAKGTRPWFNMVEHYSSAKELMSLTFRYLYMQ